MPSLDHLRSLAPDLSGENESTRSVGSTIETSGQGEAKVAGSVADSQQKLDELNGPLSDGRAENLGSSVERKDTVTREMNQSLARLEMSSLEVKLHLDSIDQRISRMEPRLEEMRVPDVAPFETRKAAEVRPEAFAGGGRVEFHAMPVSAEMSAAGSTAERRRRAQGVPIERRRAPHHSGSTEELPSGWQTLNKLRAFAFRRWMKIGVAVCVLLFVFAILSSRTRSNREVSSPAADGGPILAGATQAHPPKTSADVPWTSRAETLPSNGNFGRGPGTQQTLLPQHAIVEQGVAVTAVTSAPSVTGESSVTGKMDALHNSTQTIFPIDAASDASPVVEAGSAAENTPAPTGAVIVPGKAVGTVNRRVNVSSGVMAGNLLYSPRPAYPKGFASIFHPQGEVMMQAIISRKGRVEHIKVISGSHMLRGAAKDAVRTWRYRPYLINGMPVEVATIVTLDFKR